MNTAMEKMYIHLILNWLKICSQVRTVALEAITNATPDQASLSTPFSDLMMAGWMLATIVLSRAKRNVEL